MMKNIAAATLCVALLATSASAALIVDFAGAFAVDPMDIEVTDVGSSSHTIFETGGNVAEWTTAGGQVSGDSSFDEGGGVDGSLSGASGSLKWSMVTAVTGEWSLDGSGNIVISGGGDQITRNAADGWGVKGGGSNNIDEDILGFDFDFSNLTLPAGQFLRITEFTTSNGGSARIIVDGVSDQVVAPGAVSIDLSDGQLVAFSGDSTTSQYRLDTVTLEVVPEPATMSLLAVGGIALLRRRRRS